ncbi:chemotaxis protein CheA [Catalinimonas niigatensis]|uniref:chemotaxis protein CheA n=1 Tax=Catalinimonas niigatensis TaxID=1397264 RepID=UPI002664FF1B|nr:chemotaxis protein CheA [Catalinimonas niigatensis]WPP53536.1 chemotaxis protein CheA [Catalinimonas niigatensis]
MDKFKAKFHEEAQDLLADLEKALMSLEKSPQNAQAIEHVFRIMHTLKGNSAMFGFASIEQLTHHLENIYDLIRQGKKVIDTTILNVSLASIDHLNNLLKDEDQLTEVTKNVHQDLLTQIQSLSGSETVSPVVQEEETERRGGETQTYLVRFQPDQHILRNGTNLLYLLEELTALGEGEAILYTDKLPKLEEMEPTLCYLSWDVILATTEEIGQIREVFLFVEDEAAIDIIPLAKENLLTRATFQEKIKQAKVQAKLPALDFWKHTEILEAKAATTQSQQVASIRVPTDKLDNLMNLVSELVTTQARLSLLAEQVEQTELVSIAEEVEKISRRLRDNAFSICLIPIEHLFTRFQRMVRDISQELGKQVDFITEGGETEMDKAIIDSLADPLMHILRNSLDHGIETIAERKKKGKPAKGKILLKAFYSGTYVHIQISDDGAGIDPERVRKKAVAKGIIPADKVLQEKEIMELIFAPGFSTTEKVTEISGRGVGMDVVKQKVTELRGEVDMQSGLDSGTTLTIKLPLTLSIIDGLLVKITDTSYIIPLSAVDRCCETQAGKLNTFNELFGFEGEQIPYIDLRSGFEKQTLTQDPKAIVHIVLIRFDHLRVGLVVDHILGEYQAVLKPLGKHYKNQKFLSGGSILGDGNIALVLDTQKTIQYFTQSTKNQIAV